MFQLYYTEEISLYLAVTAINHQYINSINEKHYRKHFLNPKVNQTYLFFQGIRKL